LALLLLAPLGAAGVLALTGPVLHATSFGRGHD
jgi:hypothetical protein